MKHSRTSGGTAACGKRTAGATTVLLLALALFGTSAPAITFTWDGGTLGDSGDNDVLEKFSLDTESKTITFAADVRRNPDSGTALTLSSSGIEGNRHVMTFGPTDDANSRHTMSAANPLPHDSDGTVNAGTVTLAASAASPANDPEGGKGDAISAVLVGYASGGVPDSVFIECGFTFGRGAAAQSGSLGMAAPVRRAKADDGAVVRSGDDKADGRHAGDTFDSAGGILDTDDQSGNTIGGLSLTAGSTLDMDASDGMGSLGTASFSADGSAPPVNAGSASTDGPTVSEELFLTTDSVTSGLVGQIEFASDVTGTTRSARLIVPVPEPTNVALGVFGVIVVVFGLARRRRNFVASRGSSRR